jgi:hypothetical protein
MYHSLIGKPSLRVVLVMGLLIGLCLLLLAACGGEESAKGGLAKSTTRAPALVQLPRMVRWARPAVVLLPTVRSPLAATTNTVSPTPQSSR